MTENITINIWMILVVILSVGMIAIIVFSIYRGFKRCNIRIDDQGDSLQKIDGRINNINSEIINIRIDQANVKAIQTIKAEDSKNQPAAAPINIYQQAPPQQCVYPTVQTVQPTPQSVGHPYVQQVQQQQQQAQPQMQYWPPQETQTRPQHQQQAPLQRQYWEPQEETQAWAPQQQAQARVPQQESQKQYRAPDIIEPQAAQALCQQEQEPEQVYYRVPELVKAQRPEQVKAQAPQPRQEQESQRPQQRTQDPTGIKAPTYHQTRMPTIGLTEFQLPEEYDWDEDSSYPPRREVSPLQRPDIRTEDSPRPRPTTIPSSENIVPSKFNSLNDGISRTGKRYSEEEIANKILD